MFTRNKCASLIAVTIATYSIYSSPAYANSSSFNIPPQSLESALNSLSRQGNVQIFFPGAKIAGLKSQAIIGRMTRQAALNRLIEGSGLEVRSDDGKTVVLGSRDDTARRDGPEEADAGKNDIVVTATRRLEKSQSVAAALTVVGGDKLGEQNISTVNDLENSVPSLEATSQLGSGQTQFAVRGIGLTDYAANNTGTVGVYIDEVNHPYAVTFQGSLFDVHHVEVLRGPQGTLFGRNTTAGVVSVKTNDPTRDFQAGLDADYGRFDAAKLTGFASGPLSDTLAARVAFNVDRGGAWQYNRLTGEELGDKRRTNLRAKLAWTPGDRTRVDLSAHYDRDRSDGLGLQLRRPFQSHNFAPIGAFYPVDTNPRATGWGISPTFAALTGQSTNARPNLNNEGWGASLRLRHDLGWAELTAIVAHEKFDRKEFEDFDGTSSNEGGIYFFNRINTQSEEIRLASPTDRRLRWLAGAYRSDEKNSGGFLSDFSDVASLKNILSTSYTQPVRSTGIFGDIDYDISEKLTFTLGGRFEHEGRYLEGYQSRTLWPTPALRFTTDKELKNSQWSGKAAMTYRFSPDILAYAQVARGVKSGGFTTYNSGLPDQISPFNPEKLLSYEVGFKSELFDKRLRINASAFYYDYRDQQLQGVIFTETQRIGRLINVPRSHIIGGELEVVARPVPAVQITQSLGYKGGSYDEFNFVDAAATAALRDPVTGNYNTIVTRDQSGNPLPNFPRWDYKGSASFTLGLNGWSITPYANYSYRSSTYLTTSSTSLPSFWLVNGGVSLTPPGEHLTVGVYVNNATNARFYETANAFVTAATYTPHQVRTYGARLSWRY